MEIRATNGVASPIPAQAGKESTVAEPLRPVHTAEETSKQLNTMRLTQAISDINKSFEVSGQHVEFSIDTESKETVIKIIDQETREILRQIPTKEALEIAKALDRVQGLLIRSQA